MTSVNKINPVENKVTLTITKKNIIKEPKGKNALYDNTLEKVKYLLNSTNLTVLNLHTIIKAVMEIVEATPIKGTEQKTFALKILREIIDEKVIEEEEVMLLVLIDNGTVGNLIDLVVDASKGKLNVNAIAETTAGCLLGCLPYCMTKTKKKKVIKVN